MDCPGCITWRQRYLKVQQFRDQLRLERDSARKSNMRLNRRWQEAEAKLRSSHFRGPPQIGSLLTLAYIRCMDEKAKVTQERDEALAKLRSWG